MKKKIFTGFVVLASLISSSSFAQDIYKTAANVPMVYMPLEEKGCAYLGNMQLPANK